MIPLQIRTQPDDETCGPTSLHAIYQHYGLPISLEQIIQEVERSVSGGTLAPLLGKHALHNQFACTLYVNNLNLFDPTWFENEHTPASFLIKKLRAQRAYQRGRATIQASHAYENFLEMGGCIRFRTLNISLFKKYFEQNIPILTGLSATYLYQCAREWTTPEGECVYDDVRGAPCGHFVVLCGYDEKKRLVVVADPHRENPISHNNYYKVSISRLINAIMLGVYTFDANLLVIQPQGTATCKPLL
ncbi:MAG: peptidase-C39 like family protein [Gammaproteobacteria bacterium]|nr:peptidase-C39 like family protein [Gammaproteobacteria bacterium]